MKQTAVEWLVQEINKINVSTEARIFINKLEEKAKEMEKQQIKSAFRRGDINEMNGIENISSEQYYNETFNK